jgi:hypothetical protein
VLRTIELILGLQPLSQYDAAAAPLYAAFMMQPDTAPYAALPARWPLSEINPPGQRRSALDPRVFRRPDFADEDVLNEEIWASVRSTPMPPARHSALLVRGEK